MNTDQLQATINAFWEDHIIPALFEYIKIPNKSPSFDPEWKANGHMDRVLNLATEWAKEHMPDGAELTVKESDGRRAGIKENVPKFIRKIFESYAGVKGSKVHDSFINGALIYLSAIMQKSE